MLKLILSSLILVSSSIAYKSDYKYYPDAGAWFKLHKITATWDQAFIQCYNEGARLASPTTEKMIKAMMRILQEHNLGSNSHYIGTHSKFSPRQFVSLEGIPLENMPVTEMVQILNSQDGDCLSINDNYVNVISCQTQLPYMCYRMQVTGQNNTECGTFDEEYKLKTSTGSCYKLHTKPKTWSEANAMCVAEGGYLTIVNNEEEAHIVQDIFLETSSNSTELEGHDSVFIGLQDWDGRNTWLSIRGEPIQELYNNWNRYYSTEINWSPYQPAYEEQQCGAIGRTGEIEKMDCNRLSLFVCEKDPQNIRFSQEHQEDDYDN